MFTEVLQGENGWVGMILSDEGYYVAQTKTCKNRKDANKEASKIISKMEKEKCGTTE